MPNVYVKKSYKVINNTVDTDYGTLDFIVNADTNNRRDGQRWPFAMYGKVVFRWQELPIYKTKKEDWIGTNIKATLNKNEDWNWLWLNVYENQDGSLDIQISCIEWSKRTSSDTQEDDAWTAPAKASDDILPF